MDSENKEIAKRWMPRDFDKIPIQSLEPPLEMEDTSWLPIPVVQPTVS